MLYFVYDFDDDNNNAPSLRGGGIVSSGDCVLGELLLTPTRVAGVKRSSASVCVCVCSHDRTKTAETTTTKLATGIVYHESRYLVTHLILGQKVKGQGHRVTKCKNIFRAIEWPE